MCIRFVGEKRIDLLFDENNFIEIDASGHPQDPAGSQPPQIRLHSKDWRIQLDSEKDSDADSPQPASASDEDYILHIDLKEEEPE